MLYLRHRLTNRADPSQEHNPARKTRVEISGVGLKGSTPKGKTNQMGLLAYAGNFGASFLKLKPTQLELRNRTILVFIINL